MGERSEGSIIKADEATILKSWVGFQLADSARRDVLTESEVKEQSKNFLATFSLAAQHSFNEKLSGSHWDDVRASLSNLSKSRATSGFTPAETASFVFSLKQPLFDAVRKAH